MSIVIEIYEKLMAINSFGIAVQFEWVPAHCGISGNERADLLTKQVSDKQHVDIVLSQSKREIMREADKFYKSMWQERWNIDTFKTYNAK